MWNNFGPATQQKQQPNKDKSNQPPLALKSGKESTIIVPAIEGGNAHQQQQQQTNINTGVKTSTEKSPSIFSKIFSWFKK